MATLTNPHTGKTVEADGDSERALLTAGFKPVEEKRPAKAKAGRPKKSD